MPDSAPPSPRLSALANRLNSVAIHLLRRISRDDDDDGVTGARLSALSVLVYGGPRSLGELAAAERVATPTMSRTIEAMVREGLVQRRTSPADRRALVLTATEEGKRLLE
ncbi:MAG TPA: MarR family transcriptional regulator, partial [Thermoanaerobaculia bacterium]|nr:MarR family transcriptional regulator [Thermoanaerobaculia bacterium]